MKMKIFAVGMIIISALVMSNIVIPPPSLLASSKGLKLYLTVDTNLNGDIRIYTYQYGERRHIKCAMMNML
jgi:hypothetical protein